MGNDPNKYISLHIKEEDIQEVIDEQKKDNFYQLYQQFTQTTGFLNKEDLAKLTKIEDPSILEQIFDIFGSKKGKMYFSDLIMFYTSFTNKKLKSVLLSFLLFGKNGKITSKIYSKNLSQLLSINNSFLILADPDFLKFITYVDRGYYSYLSWKNISLPYFNNNNKEKDAIYYDKNLFIERANLYIKNKVLNYSFFNGYNVSSILMRKPINSCKKKTYICDCLLENMNLNINSSDELEEMRKNFNAEKTVKNGHLPFTDFEKIMKEYRVNQKLIDLIIKFLKFYTMKDYLNFEDFKNLMSNIYFRESLTQKKKFLFKMILTIANEKTSIKASQFCKILQIENKEYKPSGTIDEKTFETINDPIINSEIDTYIGYMDTLGLIPYLKFGVKLIGQDLKKKIINFILNNKTAEEYLIENFDKYEYFYPLNITFWNSIIEPGAIPEIEINNSLIAEEDKIFYIKKNEEENNKKEENEEKKQQNQKENENNKKENEKNVQKEKEEENKNTIELNKKEKKIGKLKKDVKYGKDYVIICGDLYRKIANNFDIDYEIALTKITKYIPEQKEEKKEEKEVKTNDGNVETITPEEKEIKEEKLEINAENNYLYKKGNEKEGIKEYIVDFYPINIIQLSFSTLITFVEEEKKKLDKKKAQEEWEKKPQEEKDRIMKEKELIKKNNENRNNKYIEKLKQLHELFNEGAIAKSVFDEKVQLLNEQFKDIFPQDNEKKGKNEITRLKKSEFFEILKLGLNNFISDRLKKVQKYPRNTTVKDIKTILIKFNDDLKKCDFDIIFYTLENSYNIVKDETTFIDNNIKDFTLVIADIKSKKGENYLSILEKNEANQDNENEEKKEDKIKQNELKKVDDVLSKDELKKIKENQNEREKLKKQQEKLEKDKLEKEKLEIEKMKKEQEKIKEKYIRPPYGIPNFGNTCYFNAINQIFLNLPIMQQLFMNQNLKYFINKNNKFGYKGKFITAFMSLYQLYPSKIDDYAQNLKSLVGKFKDTFNNRDQQDANEYLNFVLEALHEELNAKSSKRYIMDKDENYKYNNEEQLGNIAWANNLRRNVSFIDSIFMFQLKSNLTCKKCGTKKFNFETNYVLDLPLSLCKVVTVDINLYRLPFKYKIYYDKINKNFSDFINLEENKNKNIIDNLWDYYTVKLNYEQKLEHLVHITFEFDFERQKSIEDILKLLRNISILDLEPENYEININNPEITEYKINHYTDFIVYSYDKSKIIKNDTIIDKFVDINDRIRLNIYEVFNSNGLNLIKKNKDCVNNGSNPELNLYSYKIKRKGISKYKDYKNEIQKIKKDGNAPSTTGETPSEENKINMLSLNDKILYYENDIFDNSINNEQNTKKANKFKIFKEYLIPIVHYRRDLNPGRSSIFLDFYYSGLKGFPKQFLVFNNSNYYQITPKYLYNYIWDYNSLYMNHPNKKKDKFWWNLDPNSTTYSKKCYPFVIRIVKKKNTYKFSFDCAKCQWYNFCFGCILYPDDDKYLEMKSDYIIFVDWCNSLIKEEIDSYNFNIKKFSDEEIINCIESQAKNDKSKQYQSIKDCFDLFFEKELLEDPLSCRVCGGPQNFYKNYEINKLPYILILSLKRFKYNENNNFKLKQLITYPIKDFELKNQKYDLFGVIYHYGSINSGHYICSIKHENKWIICDDRNVYEIGEERVMNSNAYILFYISKDSINNNSYYNCLKSLMQHLVIDKNKKTYYFEDYNFFKGEPVETDYGEGYIVEDYIEDFKFEENNNENSQKNDKENKEESSESETKEETSSQNIISEDNNSTKNINKNGLIKVKFDFGEGIIYKTNIKKQILKDH